MIFSNNRCGKKNTINHYRKTQICRVSWPLPSTRTRTLGKDVLCRVPGHEHSANICHTACPSFAECRLSATNGTRQIRRTCPARAPAVRRPLGGLMASSLCRVPPPGTRQRGYFAECLEPGTRQRGYFAECLEPGSRQIFFCRVLELRYSAKLGKKFFFDLQNFLVSS